MKKSLSHLPKHKQEELKLITDTINYLKKGEKPHVPPAASPLEMEGLSTLAELVERWLTEG